jgi:ethylbenzene dioxygenase subunit beta
MSAPAFIAKQERPAPGAPVSDALLLKIERLLRFEARLLDEERYRAWYELLADDLFYYCPVRANRYRRDPRADVEAGGMAFFEDGKADIDMRLKRLESGQAWIEDPPTRHVYAISNVEAFETPIAGEYDVRSVFVQYRNRAEKDEALLMGRREDVWRETETGFLLARRTILLGQSTLLTKNMSVFL